MTERKYWASKGRIKSGPVATREEAIALGRITFAKRLERRPRDKFTTGYGENGPWFDMRFHGEKDNG